MDGRMMRPLPTALPNSLLSRSPFSLLNFMSAAIIDNLWKINSELPHVSVAPETVIAPPLCLSVASAALYDDDRHAFVFVCLLSVLLCGSLFPCSVCVPPPLSVPGILMPFVESAAVGSDSNNAAGSRSEPDSFSSIRFVHAYTDLPTSCSGKGERMVIWAFSFGGHEASRRTD